MKILKFEVNFFQFFLFLQDHLLYFYSSMTLQFSLMSHSLFYFSSINKFFIYIFNLFNLHLKNPSLKYFWAEILIHLIFFNLKLYKVKLMFIYIYYRAYYIFKSLYYLELIYDFIFFYNLYITNFKYQDVCLFIILGLMDFNYLMWKKT
jgi:hypothetical protein